MPSSNSSSSSSSSTTQVTNAINPVVVADNGSMAFSNVAGGDVNQTVNNTTLDGNVAIRAMDNTLTAAQGALLFGNDAMRQSYAFSDRQSDRAYGFASEQSGAAYSFAGAAGAASNAASAKAMDSVSASMDKAMAFGGKQTAVAFDSLSQSASMLDRAYKDAKGVLGTNVILVAIAAGVVIVYFAMGKK